MPKDISLAGMEKVLQARVESLGLFLCRSEKDQIGRRKKDCVEEPHYAAYTEWDA